MKPSKPLATLLTALLALAWVSTADAQWVAVGRIALGKVRELTQSEKSGEPGYSVATVLVTGHAEKVYAAALKTVQASPKFRLTKQVPEKQTMEFTDGKQVAGLSISQINPDVVQILIASVVKPGGPDTTSLVVSATLRVCKEMGAECAAPGSE